MAKRSEQLQELTDRQKEIEVIEENMSRIEDDMKTAWLEQQPIRSHEDIVKDYADIANINLTSAKESLSEYPKKYEIEGKDVPTLIKEMRKYRRTLKGETKIAFTNSIDSIIKAYADYLNDCIDSI